MEKWVKKMKKTMTFSREQLYKEIWEVSAREVANKYGLNYPSLLKKCKEYNIPLPNGKYWYNKNTGNDIKNLIIPLSNLDQCQYNRHKKLNFL